ncbi:MAG: hypothetical protein M3500_03295 [Actinomycetota bacterium]|nr:hypothetical protein [Actinomycetota bacterium]
MRKLARAGVTVAAFIGIGAIVALGGVTAAGAADPAGKPQLEITAVQVGSGEVAGGEDFVGTRFVGTDDLFRDGVKVGRGARSCEVVGVDPARPGTAQFQCLFTLELPHMASSHSKRCLR